MLSCGAGGRDMAPVAVVILVGSGAESIPGGGGAPPRPAEKRAGFQARNLGRISRPESGQLVVFLIERLDSGQEILPRFWA